MGNMPERLIERMSHLVFDHGETSPNEVIFVADDHEDAYLLDQALAVHDQGSETLHFPTVEACRNYLHQQHAAGGLKDVLAILVDLTLPGARGLNYLRELKACMETRDLPVIMLAKTGHPIARMCHSEGAEHVMEKPGDLAGFEQLVSHLATHIPRPLF